MFAQTIRTFNLEKMQWFFFEKVLGIFDKIRDIPTIDDSSTVLKLKFQKVNLPDMTNIFSRVLTPE